MLVENDILRVVVNQLNGVNNSPVLNVFWYQAREVVGVGWTVADYQSLAAEVYLGMSGLLSPIQVTELTYVNAVVDNMTNLVDTATYIPAIPAEGTGGVQGDPSQTAASFKLVRSTKLTRHGSKRFGGLGDIITSDPMGDDFSVSAACLAIEVWLSNEIEVVVGGGNEAYLYPVIVQRTAVGVPVTVINDVS